MACKRLGMRKSREILRQKWELQLSQRRSYALLRSQRASARRVSSKAGRYASATRSR